MRKKRVFRNAEELIHAWANPTERYETNLRTSNMYCEGPILFSYGSHYPLMIRVKVPNKPMFYLLNSYHYSSTTSGHQSCARGAVHDGQVYHLNMYEYAHVIRYMRSEAIAGDHQAHFTLYVGKENKKRFQGICRAEIAKLYPQQKEADETSAKARVYKARPYANLDSNIARVSNLCSLFGVKIPKKLLTLGTYCEQRYAELLPEEEHKVAILNARPPRSHAFNSCYVNRILTPEEQEKRTIDWLLCRDNPNHSLGWNHALMRIKGESFETTMGMRFRASRVIPLFQQIIQPLIESAQRHGPSIHYTQPGAIVPQFLEYPIYQVLSNGDMRIGCHQLKGWNWNLMLAQLGLPLLEGTDPCPYDLSGGNEDGQEHHSLDLNGVCVGA
jgi:hypothetical protein